MILGMKTFIILWRDGTQSAIEISA